MGCMVTGAVDCARAEPPQTTARAAAEMVKAKCFMSISLFAFVRRLPVEAN
jgi:hypothetical protein